MVHGSYEIQTQQFLDDYSNLAEATDFLWKKLDAFQELGKDKIMFENSISPLFYFGEEEMDREIYARKYRLAYDVSHAFIKLQGNQVALEKSLAYLKNNIVHYHLADLLDPREQLESHAYLEQLRGLG